MLYHLQIKLNLFSIDICNYKWLLNVFLLISDLTLRLSIQKGQKLASQRHQFCFDNLLI